MSRLVRSTHLDSLKLTVVVVVVEGVRVSPDWKNQRAIESVLDRRRERKGDATHRRVLKDGNLPVPSAPTQRVSVAARGTDRVGKLGPRRGDVRRTPALR